MLDRAVLSGNSIQFTLATDEDVVEAQKKIWSPILFTNSLTLLPTDLSTHSLTLIFLPADPCRAASPLFNHDKRRLGQSPTKTQPTEREHLERKENLYKIKFHPPTSLLAPGGIFLFLIFFRFDSDKATYQINFCTHGSE